MAGENPSRVRNGVRAVIAGLTLAAAAVMADDTPPSDSAAAPVPSTETPATPSPPAPSPFTANITLISQYVTRGIRQTYRKPAVQGGFDFASHTGIFLGTWMSNVSDKVLDNATLEWDLYGGYGNEIGPVRYSVTAFYYYYPGAHTSDATGHTRYNFVEIIPSLSYKFFTIKYAVTATRDFFGYNSNTLGGASEHHSRGSGYLDVNGNFELPYTTTLLLHYGFQEVRHFEQANFQDMKLGLTKAFDGGWSLGVAYTTAWDKHHYYKNYTNTEPGAPTSNPLASTVLFSVSRLF